VGIPEKNTRFVTCGAALPAAVPHVFKDTDLTEIYYY
jgi:hypothetical protein